MERLRLYFYAGEIAYLSFTYEKVNKTDSLQPYGCKGRLYHIFPHLKFCIVIKSRLNDFQISLFSLHLSYQHRTITRNIYVT